MNIQITSKTDKKTTEKSGQSKPDTGYNKALSQLRQEVAAIGKTVEDLQKKQDCQVVFVSIPNSLLSRINDYLSEISAYMGYPVLLSQLINDALEMYLWGEEQKKKMEQERMEQNSTI